ncbi:MAG: DMT family transporter [Notoacmeibacter sp.]|nr:DMT family transporter [Notoacmeibacter sp.]
MTPSSDHVRGLAITGLGGLALTFDIPLLRLGGGDAWSVVLLRAACTFAVIGLVWLFLKRTGRRPPPLFCGRTMQAVTLLYALTGLAFMLAVFVTPTANLVFILALNPMLAALMGRVFLGERLRPQTLAALLVMILGVFLIVRDGLAAGNVEGNLLAGFAAITLAAAITVSRTSDQPMGFTNVAASLITVLAAGVVIMWRGTGFHVEAPFWVVLDGALMMPVALFCLYSGPKWLPGPEVAMFYMLETVLAPVWVWLIFAETPTPMTLTGGAILLAALLAHTGWQILRSRVPHHVAD